MTPPAQVTHGVSELCRLLQEQTFDVRSLDLAGFRDWLGRQLTRWHHDPVFVQRARIRDLRRAHPHLQILEKAYRCAVKADTTSPSFQRLRRLEQELRGADQALAGLSAAQEHVNPAKRRLLEAKREAFQTRRQALLAEQAKLIEASPQRQALIRATTALQQFRSAIGLEQQQDVLDELMQHHGRHSGRAGKDFEELACALTRSLIVPGLLRGGSGDDALRRLRVLRKVTLGAARVEFDQVVIRPAPRPDRPVDVLAVVEIKRNLNDLAHGFRHRQENLAWLTGDATRYDPAQYRTKRFRTGHFDCEAVHEQDGERFVFARSSFRRFRSEPGSGRMLNRLYFITRTGTLWGISTAALARIGHRVATDEHGNLADDSYLGELLRWSQALANPIETPDVLRMYCGKPRQARQILIASWRRSE